MAEFWTMTPADFHLVVTAHGEAALDARRLAAWQALTAATLGRVRKMPAFETLLQSLGAGQARHRRSADELLAAARRIGGTFREAKRP